MDSRIEEIKKWLNRFAICVRNHDFEGGRAMFFKDAFCFGSKAEILKGIDDLVERQWKIIWPYITDFNFNFDQIHCEMSREDNYACVTAPWISTGHYQDGTSFPRPGRVTILLIFDTEKNTWLAKHTHYSLFPGTPNHTFGQPRK